MVFFLSINIFEEILTIFICRLLYKYVFFKILFRLNFIIINVVQVKYSL